MWFGRTFAFPYSLALFICFAQLATAHAIEVRTYEFVPDQDRLLSFGGGLLGINVSARLAGSFDIRIEDSGASSLTRFDVQLYDIVDNGMFAPGWNEGELLSNQLFVSPVGLSGQRTGASIELGERSFLPEYYVDGDGVVSWGLKQNTPNTLIQLQELDGGLARLQISSSPQYILDNPSFQTDSSGLLVRLVPEPASSLILLIGTLCVVVRTRIR